MPTEKVQVPPAPSPDKPAPGLRLRWDETGARASRPSLCNVQGTREAVTLSFGLNQPWNPEDPEVPVQVTDRIVLQPTTAKFLAFLLLKVLQEYEARFGVIPGPWGGNGRPPAEKGQQ